MAKYVLSEPRLRSNLGLIRSVSERSGVEIILAYKAYAFWPSFGVVREYGFGATASSLNEARLATEYMHTQPHSYAPVYLPEELPEIARLSSQLTFNSLGEYARHSSAALEANPSLSLGLRVNPGYSPVATALYNPCSAGSRLGIPVEQLPEQLPAGVDGLHVHALCESSAAETATLLGVVEERLGPWLGHLRWLNLGGGHLMTRQGYDIEGLIDTLLRFRQRHPGLQVILEPGSAFGWQAGYLQATVLDIVNNGGLRTATLDVSFACHMPDCLEMPYQPTVRGAETLPGDEASAASEDNVYRLGGCSCLAGDFVGLYRFHHPLTVGEEIILEDMMHYTTVKTTMFNGVAHPSLCIDHGPACGLEEVRRFNYSDYVARMG